MPSATLIEMSKGKVKRNGKAVVKESTDAVKPNVVSTTNSSVSSALELPNSPSWSEWIWDESTEIYFRARKAFNCMF